MIQELIHLAHLVPLALFSNLSPQPVHRRATLVNPLPGQIR